MKATERELKILALLIQGMTKAELIDAIAASAKLTKADVGIDGKHAKKGIH